MSNNKKKSYLLDTMVLINFMERCISHDLLTYFKKLDIRFYIVEEVEREFKRKIKPIGESRFALHSKDQTIIIIPDNEIEIDTQKMNYLINNGFGRGELFSALYYVMQENLEFVSDEKLVRTIFKKKFNIDIIRTSDLLKILVDHNLITEDEKNEIFAEMIRNGLWIKT